MNVLVKSVVLIVGMATLVAGQNKDDTSLDDHRNSWIHDSCLGGCLQTLIEELNEKVGRDTMDQLMMMDVNAVMEILSNSQQFKGFCISFSKFKSCKSKCPGSLFKTLITKGSEVIDYFCIDKYTDIVRYFPCIGKFAKNETCIAPCQGEHDVLVENVPNFGDILMGGTEQIRLVFNTACSYFSCSLDCDMEPVYNKCGLATVQLMAELVSHSFNIIDNLIVDTGLLQDTPPACVRLNAYSMPDFERNKDADKKSNKTPKDLLETDTPLAQSQQNAGSVPSVGVLTVIVTFLVNLLLR